MWYCKSKGAMKTGWQHSWRIFCLICLKDWDLFFSYYNWDSTWSAETAFWCLSNNIVLGLCVGKKKCAGRMEWRIHRKEQFVLQLFFFLIMWWKDCVSVVAVTKYKAKKHKQRTWGYFWIPVLWQLQARNSSCIVWTGN